MHLLDSPIRSEEMLSKTIDIKHRFYASSSEPLRHSDLIELAKRNGDHDLIAAYNDHSLGYAESGGSLDLRQEIAKQYGPDISAENIVVFPGAQTGMTLANQALLHKGDHCIIITPSYQSLEEGTKLAGAEVTRIALTAENDWLPDLDAIEAAIKPNTKHIVFNDPHNPSGSLMSEAIKFGLVSLAEKHDILLFSDEVYRLLEIDPADRSPSIADLTKNGLALATMSKPWGAGGTGIGWVACQDKAVIEKILKAQHIYAVCFSRPGEIQAMMILRSSATIVGRNMKIIKDNLKLLDVFFDEYSDLFEWVRPKASGTGFVKFKGPLSGDTLAKELLDAGILVFGPSIFDCQDSLPDYIRIGFSRSTMPKALDAFKAFVDNRRETWEREHNSWTS